MDFIESTMFSEEAIRDTDVHNSVGVDAQELPVKTIIAYNGLNQIVTLQVQGSRDNTNFFNVGNSFEVASTAWYWQTCDTFFPYGRVVAQCSVAPASGGLSIWCEKVRA
jgi:hypothetical protein